MKKLLTVLTAICMIFLLAGCSDKSNGGLKAKEEPDRFQALEDENDKVSQYAVSLDTMHFKNLTDTHMSPISRSILGVFDAKVLYYTLGSDHNMCYMYDFETQQCQAIGPLGDFNYASRVEAFIDDTLYFELYEGAFWTFDFSDKELSKAQESNQPLNLIMMTNLGDKILALHGKKDNEGTMEYYLQTLDREGNFTPVALGHNDLNSFAAQSADHKIRHIDSDGEYIFALEVTGSEDDSRYYVTKYTSDFECVYAKEITSILDENDIDHVTYFYAFNDYFVVHDMSVSYTILCRYTDDEMEMLMSGDKLVYAENSGVNDTFEYFYIRRSNELFRLNKQTGVIEPLNCELSNDNTTIQWIKVSEDNLVIEKAAQSDAEDMRDFWYIVPGKNLGPGEGDLPNETNENAGFVEAGKVYVEVIK